jgi:hypothetical protein
LQRKGETCVIDTRVLRPFPAGRAEAPATRSLQELCPRYDAILLFPELHPSNDETPALK